MEIQGVSGTNVDKLMAEVYASGLATIGMGYCTEGLVGQVHPAVDEEKCNGCGRCAELCKVDAISIVLGKAVIDSDKCISCGWCIRGCPHEAVLRRSEVTRCGSEATMQEDLLTVYTVEVVLHGGGDS